MPSNAITTERCPCDTVKDLQHRVDEHEHRINKQDITIAVITTKLNVLIGILVAIAIPIMGIAVKLLFNT